MNLLLIGGMAVVLLVVVIDLKMRKSRSRMRLLDDSLKKPSTVPHHEPLWAFLKDIYQIFRQDIRKEGWIEEFTHKLTETDFCPGSKSVRMFQSSMFGFATVTTWDASLARDVMFGKQVGKANFGGVQERLLGESILLVEKEEHKRQKKIISPAFGWEQIQGTMHHINDVSTELNDTIRNMLKWSTEKNMGNEIELFPVMQAATMDAIGRAGFGLNFKALHNFGLRTKQEICGGAEVELGDDFYEDYEAMMKELQNPIHFFPKLDALMGTANKMWKKMDKFDKVIDGIVDKKKEMWANVKDGEERKGSDLLDLFLLAHDDVQSSGSEDENESEEARKARKLSSKQFRDNLNTFFVAGHETTAGGISGFIYHMAVNPEWQDKVRSDVNAAFDVAESENREISSVDIKGIESLHNSFKESLRLLPPAPLVLRRALDDFQLDSYHIPAGTNLMVNVHAIHHSAEYWEEPEKFDPDRFTAARSKNRHHYAWMPFAIGPRQCIGNNFALLEMKIICAYLLRNFKFSASDDMKSRKSAMETVLVPANKTKLIVEAIR